MGLHSSYGIAPFTCGFISLDTDKWRVGVIVMWNWGWSPAVTAQERLSERIPGNSESELSSRQHCLHSGAFFQSLLANTVGAWEKTWVQVALLKVSTLILHLKIPSFFSVVLLRKFTEFKNEVTVLYHKLNTVRLTAEESEGWGVWDAGCQQWPCCCLVWLKLTWSISKLRTWTSFPQMSITWSWTLEWEVFICVDFHFQFDFSFCCRSQCFTLCAALLEWNAHKLCRIFQTLADDG